MNRRTIVLGLALAPMPARAHSFKQGDIAIGHAWALPTRLARDKSSCRFSIAASRRMY
jgi:hypothetical protein